VGDFVRALCPDAFAAQRKLISRISSPALRRTPLPDGSLVPVSTGGPMNTGRLTPIPLVPSSANPGLELGSSPPGSDPGTVYEATLVRPSGTAPTVVSPATPGQAAQLGTPVSGPVAVSRKGWTLALVLGALGLVGATAGITTVLMNRSRPPPPEWSAQDGREPMPPPGWGPQDGRGLPPPPHHLPPPPPEGFERGPGPTAEAPPVPESSPAEAAAPAEPKPEVPEAATPPAEPKPEVAEVQPPGKSKPTETHSRGPRLIPAESVALMKPGRGELYLVARGKQAGLTEGMVLQVVAAPVKDGKARLLGEATVVEVSPRLAALHGDARVVGAGKVDRFVVLPKPSAAKAEPAPTVSAPEPATTPPDAGTAPTADKPAPRELMGRIWVKTLGPFAQKVTLTNADTITWHRCMLVKGGRDVYELADDLKPGEVLEVALGDFVKGDRDVPFVGKNRLGLFCTEGQKEFPAKL
jgi:hypothetical protein